MNSYRPAQDIENGGRWCVAQVGVCGILTAVLDCPSREVAIREASRMNGDPHAYREEQEQLALLNRRNQKARA